MRKIDWLELEREIRTSLECAKAGDVTDRRALEMISDALGDHTGRGYILESDPLSPSPLHPAS